MPAGIRLPAGTGARMTDLQDAVMVLTGASSGIGRAAALTGPGRRRRPTEPCAGPSTTGAARAAAGASATACRRPGA